MSSGNGNTQPQCHGRGKSVKRSANFSPCRTWRYTLHRSWADKPLFGPVSPGIVMFIGLNPSTADEVTNDPTVRRCIGFARAWGYSSFIMTNIFAFRATYPRDMKAAHDPVGPDNDKWLIECAREAALVVAAWGNDGAYRDRSRQVVEMMEGAGVQLMCLRMTKAGEAEHPLYLPGKLRPTPFAGSVAPVEAVL